MDISRIILSGLALTLGILTSVYFVVCWWRDPSKPHARALLFWAFSLFLMYWFQIPAILFSIRKVIVVSDFNLFFALTFPITFLAFIFIYLGILQIFEIQTERGKNFFTWSWFIFAIFFFTYHFIARKGVIETYSFPIVGNLLFYVPIRMLIIFITVRWFIKLKSRNIYSILGTGGIVMESALGLLRNFFVIKNTLIYPPQLWYFVIGSSRFFFITQTISIVLLVIGFYFLHLYYHRLRTAIHFSKETKERPQ